MGQAASGSAAVDMVEIKLADNDLFTGQWYDTLAWTLEQQSQGSPAW